MRGLTLALIAALGAVGIVTASSGESPSERPLVDLARASFKDATPVRGGVKFDLDLGERRTNWTQAKWSVVELDAAEDLSAYEGIRVEVQTDKPRTDVGVYVAVREADGTWYCHPWAADLNLAKNTGLARFEDFTTPDYSNPSPGTHFDENDRLDLASINAVAVGTINPMGVGKVSFTLGAMTLVPTAARPAAPVAVQVTGRTLDINGTSAIPGGVFGSFNLKEITVGDKKMGRPNYYRLAMDRRIHHPSGLGSKPAFGDATTHMILNSLGDRTQPSPRANEAQWKEKYEQLGRTYAEAGKASGKTLYVEFWNEPYLNWANKNRVAFNPSFFDVSKATEGGPVTLKIDGVVAPHLKWTRNYDAPPWNWVQPRYNPDGTDNWRRGMDASGKVYSSFAVPYNFGRKGSTYNPATHPPRDVPDGKTYVLKDNKSGKETTLTAFTPWHVYDETQFTYWSGKGMLMFYIDPMLAFGRELKKGMPEAVFIAGWGNRASEDHWAGFHQIYKPTIDAGIDIIDGVCDHDYGGDPRKMAGCYEVVTAYGVTKYNKWLHNYNTETASMTDPQAVPGADAEAKGAMADRRKFDWTVRKLLTVLNLVPDKTRSLAWFGIGGGWFSDTGEGVAMNLLKNLRGRMVQVVNPEPTLHIVASVDGTDPLNPRPADMPQRQELVVAALNDATRPQAVQLTIAAPQGMKFTGPGVLRTVPEGRPEIVESPVALPAGGQPVNVTVTLPARSIMVWTFPVAGELPAKSAVSQKQYFAKPILVEIVEGKPAKDTVKIDAAQLRSAKRAWVRVVAERIDDDEAVMLINGKSFAIPRLVSPDNTPRLREFPIDPAVLKDVNQVEFKVTGPEHGGYLLCAGSIIVQSE